MIYIIMAGGTYQKWATPRQLLEFRGEPIIARTIRLLKEHGVSDIFISSDNDVFEQFNIPVLKHDNGYNAREYNDFDGYWCDAFYPTEEPACYIFGDVIFSEEAIKKIVETETDDIEFFASAPPFDKHYYKQYAEPFALKVVNQKHLRQAISLVKIYDQAKVFNRKPIMWELWQVIKRTPVNIIDYTNYTAINDWTCDVDDPEDIEKILKFANLEWVK